MIKLSQLSCCVLILISSCSTGGNSGKACVWADSTCVTRNLSFADGTTGNNLELSYQNIDPKAPLQLSGAVAITEMTAILNLAAGGTPKPFQFRWTSKQVKSNLDLCISLRNSTVQVCMVLPVTPASNHGLASLLVSNRGTLVSSATKSQIRHDVEVGGDSPSGNLTTVRLDSPGQASGDTGAAKDLSDPKLEGTESQPGDDSGAVVTVAAKVVSERDAIETIDPSLSAELDAALDQTYNGTNQNLHALADITGGALAVSAAVGQKGGNTAQKSSAISAFLAICQTAITDPVISSTPDSLAAALKTIASVVPEVLKGLTSNLGLTGALTKMSSAGTLIINQILAQQTPVPSTIVSILTPSSGGGGGSSNTPWGTTGIVKTAVSSNDDYGNAVAIQSDGKVVVAGSSNGDILVLRYNTNGSLDTTFDSDGIVTTDIASGDDSANAIAIQSDGKILVAGSAYDGSDQHLVIVRYNTNGSLDTSFATAGIYNYSLTGDNQLNGILLQTDGKMVVGGTVGGKFFLARLVSTGSLDSSFGTSGVVNAALGSSTADDLKTFVLQSDGKFVAVGSTTISGQLDSAIVRYTSAGALDTTFNTTGVVTVDSSGASNEDAAVSVALNSDNTRIVVGGYTKAGDRDAVLLLYDNNGSVVSGFGTSGIVTFGTSGGGTQDDQVYAVKFTSDGYILAAGQVYNSTDTTSDSFVRKYDTSGSLVTSFGTSGITITNVDSKDNYSIGMALQSDGKIVLAGTVETGTNNNDVVTIRLKSNGALDI